MECSDKTYYTGITNNIERRIEEHNTSDLGAKYTRARRPVKLVFEKRVRTRSRALKLEDKIKKLKRSDKQLLIKGRITIK